MNNNKQYDNYLITPFEKISKSYDNIELKFFRDSAKEMVDRLNLADVNDVLDLATGTGNNIIELHSKNPSMHITGIDISRPMLNRAQYKVKNIPNIKLILHDMEYLNDIKNKFDLMTCSYGVYFIKDMVKFFENIIHHLNKRGRFAVTNFADGSFLPFSTIYMDDLSKIKEIREFAESFTAYNELCVANLKLAGFKQVQCIEKEMSYNIYQPLEWWTVISGSELSHFLMDLSEEKLGLFKNIHLNNIDKLIKEGIKTYKIKIEIIIAEL